MRPTTIVTMIAIAITLPATVALAADQEHVATGNFWPDCWSGSWSASGEATYEAQWDLYVYYGADEPYHSSSVGPTFADAGMIGPWVPYIIGYLYADGERVNPNPNGCA